jgi:two-component system, OmpR family, KDP operon response regulator KdpE
MPAPPPARPGPCCHARAKIEALANGADDYMTEPFSPGELVARLAARLRSAPSALRFEVDGLTIDLAAHLVTVDGHRSI